MSPVTGSPALLRIDDPEERRRRITEITSLVEKGRYAIPAVRVAEAILAFHRRET